MILLLIFGSVGVLFFVLGWQIWKKEKIGLLQEYHRDKVSETDWKRFCTLCGIGMCTMGVGMLLSAVWYGMFQNPWSLAAFSVGFVTGLGLMIRAIWKYNR